MCSQRLTLYSITCETYCKNKVFFFIYNSACRGKFYTYKYGTVEQFCIQDDISCLLQRSYFYFKKKLANSSSFMQIVVWETIEHDIFCISLKAVKLTSVLHSFKEHFLLSKIIFCRPHANFKILDLCNSFENQKCRKLWRLYH